MTITSLACCGIKEFGGLSNYTSAKAAMTDFCKGWSPTRDPSYGNYSPNFNCAFAIFSEAGSGATYGTKFAAYITKNKLGEVTEVPGKRNPNSGNNVRPFVWALDAKALQTWAQKNCSWLKKTGVNAANV